jgi:hypothetical protein
MKKRFFFFCFVLAAACVFAAGPSTARAAAPGVYKTAPVATFSGSWHEIGRQIGGTYPDQVIEFGWTMKIALLFAGPGKGWTAQDYYDAIKDDIPQSILDHLQGLADGLVEARPISPALAWDLVLTQNFAVELMNMKKNMSAVPEPPAEVLGCTGFAVTSAAGTFLCHNTDSQPSANNLLALMYWAPANGDNGYMTFDPPGWVDVSFGLNDKGIGVNLNAGNPNTAASIGLPVNLMLRTVMEHAATLDEAVGYFEDYLASGKSFGTSGTLAHIVDFNAKTMAKLQVRSQALEVTYGETTANGATFVASANHFVGDFNPDPDYYYESSFERYKRVLELIGSTHTFDLAGCLAILKDTAGGQATNNTISRIGDGSGTIMATIFTADGLYYTVGPPHLYLEKYTEPQYVAMADIATSDLTEFRARGFFWLVALRWKVAAGAGITGFNLYRAMSQDGEYRKINSEPLPADKTGSNTYTHNDLWLLNGLTYYYKIELLYGPGISKTFSFVQAKPRFLSLFGL